jgi:hypothetical protein
MAKSQRQQEQSQFDATAQLLWEDPGVSGQLPHIETLDELIQRWTFSFFRQP